MKLLIDANLSPRLLAPLRAGGFDATHVADIGLATATDSEIFDHAVSDNFVISPTRLSIRELPIR